MAVPKKKVKQAPDRKRAHKEDGTFKADDPSTPDVNEAFEAPAVVDPVRAAQLKKTPGTRSTSRRFKGKLVE